MHKHVRVGINFRYNIDPVKSLFHTRFVFILRLEVHFTDYLALLFNKAHCLYKISFYPTTVNENWTK